MNPRTKLQIDVECKARNVLPISDEQVAWAYSFFDKHYVFKSKNTAVCFECGHEWPDDTPRKSLMTSIGEYTCPKCKKELQIMETRSWRRKDFHYVTFISIEQGYQVLRTYHVERCIRKLTPADYWIHEVYQHWISPAGKHVIRAIGCNGFNVYGEHPAWNFKPMEVRKDHDRYYLSAYVNPDQQILPEIKRNGYHGERYGWSYVSIFTYLLSKPMFETIYKRKDKVLINAFTREETVKKLWPQIKICFRNKYKIKDFSIWVDYIELLKYFNKDINSAKYLCPKNLLKEHDKLVQKKRKKQLKEKLAAQKERIKELNAIYVSEKQKYFSLKIEKGDISIVVLDSIEEFITEGDFFNHCVYANDYHTKKGSLIMSARKAGKRLETIEVNLNKFTIEQARGQGNKPSRYHSKIISMLNDNMNIIKKIHNEQSTTEKVQGQLA